MSIIPWHKNVQKKKTLTYSASPSFKGGHWTTVLDKAIAEFNQQMSHHGLALSLTKVETGMGRLLLNERSTGTAVCHYRRGLPGGHKGDFDMLRCPITGDVQQYKRGGRDVSSGLSADGCIQRPGPESPVLHALSEVGTDPQYAARSATKQDRPTPLRALWQHAPYFHDGSAPDLLAMVEHYRPALLDQKSDLPQADTKIVFDTFHIARHANQPSPSARRARCCCRRTISSRIQKIKCSRGASETATGCARRSTAAALISPPSHSPMISPARSGADRFIWRARRA